MIRHGIGDVPSLEILSLPDVKNVCEVHGTFNGVSASTWDQNFAGQRRDRSAITRVGFALAKVSNKVYPRMLRRNEASSNKVSVSEGDCHRDFARLRLPCVFTNIFNTLSVIGIDSRPERTAEISSYLSPTYIEGGDGRVSRLFRKCERAGGVSTLSICRFFGECVSGLGLLKREQSVGVLSVSGNIRVINSSFGKISEPIRFARSGSSSDERKNEDYEVSFIEPIALMRFLFGGIIGTLGVLAVFFGDQTPREISVPLLVSFFLLSGAWLSGGGPILSLDI